ncbi:MAG: AraC family transcriptional regulator [Blautia sp.]|nr:AraC family transcriptional regulator [Blautia sp.]
MKKGTEKSIGVTESEHFKAVENLQEIQRMPGCLPISLNYFGAEDCMSGYAFGPFIRTNYVIHMIRSGKGRLLKNGITYEIQTGQAFLIYPGEETVYQADLEDPWSYLWVGFHGLMAEELMERIGFSPSEPVIWCRDPEQVIQTMDNLLACKELSLADDLKRTGYLYQLLALLTENGPGQTQSISSKEDAESRYVREAVNLLMNSGNPQMKISDIAKAIGISRGYLTRIFTDRTGTSPQEFQRRFRMERAGDLLRSTRSSVTAIAEELGYVDVLSFSKSFRKHFGMSPTAFREQKVVVIAGEEKGSYTSEHPL